MPPAFMLNSKKMKTSGIYHIVLIVILFVLPLETSLRRKHICNTRIISYRHIQRLCKAFEHGFCHMVIISRC